MGGRITIQLVASLTRHELTIKEKMPIFVGSEAVDSKLAKLNTSCTVILPPMVSVLCGQSYKYFTLVNYNSRVVIWGMFQSGMTLES